MSGLPDNISYASELDLFENMIRAWGNALEQANVPTSFFYFFLPLYFRFFSSSSKPDHFDSNEYGITVASYLLFVVLYTLSCFSLNCRNLVLVFFVLNIIGIKFSELSSSFPIISIVPVHDFLIKKKQGTRDHHFVQIVVRARKIFRLNNAMQILVKNILFSRSWVQLIYSSTLGTSASVHSLFTATVNRFFASEI